MHDCTGRWVNIPDLEDVGHCDAIIGGKIYDIKPTKHEDVVDAMSFSNYLLSKMKEVYEVTQERWRYGHYELPLTPKMIVQSADHRTVVVIWQDNNKTIVRLSPNDQDDIVTAFTYALAKKIFGTNTHLKKVVMSKVNEHKPKNKEKEKNENA